MGIKRIFFKVSLSVVWKSIDEWESKKWKGWIR